MAISQFNPPLYQPRFQFSFPFFMALLALHDITLGFRGPTILEGVNLTIDAGERICLLGRNGAGKTSLLRLIEGSLDPDSGEIARQQGLVTAMLPQEVPRDLSGTVFDEVARGLGPRATLLAEYHHLAHRMAVEGGEELHARLDRIQHQLEIDGGWQMHREVETAITRMNLEADADVSSLSAGMKRRVLLAKALVRGPDLLLLDEPTNHLDIDSIGWLEDFFLRYDRALLFVTHDRMFLRRLATRILDLDRGQLTSFSCEYDTYLKRKDLALEAEAKQRAEFDKKLAREEVWIRTGIQARRTRNEGRVRALEQLRATRQARREQLGEVRMEIQEAERSGRLVIEAKNASFRHAGKDQPVIRDFSTMIMRGDRVGVIGPNGSGKTTLLRVLLGELPPQSGTIRLGTNLEVAYFDQLHAQLDESKSLRDNVSGGAESVVIGGKKKHIIGYLEDFLFTTEQANGPVTRLSGGERNRLLLARLFTKPSNVLVMDEPTNDLDMETLDLLEDLLSDYPGTLLLVSHDREFLNNVVTSTLVLEGEGRVKEYAGGYDDWLRQRPKELPLAEETVPNSINDKPSRQAKEKVRRLTYHEQRELESLPERIIELEAELSEVHAILADPDFFRQSPGEIVAVKNRLQTLETAVAEAYKRWEELEAIKT
jgi:ABC transport system ATP-binding/permease protein